MREATLNGLSDLDAMRPRKARPAPAAAKAGNAKAKGAGLRRLRSRVILIAASAGFSAIMAGILCNALLVQKGHHPAPLFGAAPSEAPPPAPRALPREAAPPPAPPAAAAPEAPDAVTPAVPARKAAVHAPPPVHHAPAAKVDGIARLLGLGKADAGPAGPAPHPAKIRPGQPKNPAAKPAARAARTPANAPLQLLPHPVKPAARLAAKEHPAAAGGAAN